MLAERLHLAGINALGVLNQGIAGNCLLHDSAGLFGGGYGQPSQERSRHVRMIIVGCKLVGFVTQAYLHQSNGDIAQELAPIVC